MVTYYSNTAVETTLTGSVSSGATSIAVASTAGFPTGTFPYTLALDYGGSAEELVSVTAAASLTLTVVRGFSGTSAQSHSLGAVVRHVFHAGDATDFHTHMSGTAVHGATGAVVGTTNTQTMTNKTLTSPTINAGALSGTFTGSPTLTGGPTFTTLSALWERAAASDSAIRTRLTGDTNSRLIVNADGKLTWGTGMATGDTTLYRSAADELTTDDSLVVSGNLSVAGIGKILFARKATATSRASDATPTADPDLQLAVAANAVYVMEGCIFYAADGGASQGRINMDWSAPAGATGTWTGTLIDLSTTAEPALMRGLASDLTAARSSGAYGTATDVGVMLSGLLVTAGTAGTYAFLWSQLTSDVTGTIVREHSWLKLQRVA